MMKQLLLNQRKTGGRVTSLLVVLLTTLAMTLLPQRAWAQDESYGLTVAGTNVSAKNASNVLGDNDATVIFDAETNTLTLNGARIEGGISWEGTHTFIPASGGSASNALTINILGNNTINGAITGNIGNNPPLIFTGGNTAAAELTIDAGTQNAISGFLEMTGVGLDAPLHFVELNSSNNVNYPSGSPYYLICGNDAVKKVTITSATLYNIWIAGQQVTSNNASNVLGDKMVAFDNQSNTVILNGTTISNYSGDAIESLLGDLTIALAGSNSISCTGTAIKHASSGSTPTITFTTSNDNPGSLTLAGGEAVLGGFSNQAEPTCNNGLSWSLSQDGKTASVKRSIQIVFGYESSYHQNGDTVSEEFDEKDSFANPTVHQILPGGSYTSNVEGLTFTYSSSDETVATISEEGQVSIVGGGFTVITATCAETADHQASQAYYTLEVKPSDPSISLEEGAYFTGDKLTLNRIGQNGKLYYRFGSEGDLLEYNAETGIELPQGKMDFYAFTECVGAEEGQTIRSYGNNHRMFYVYDRPVLTPGSGTYSGAVNVQINNLPYANDANPATVYYYFGETVDDPSQSEDAPTPYTESIPVEVTNQINVYISVEGDSSKKYKTEQIVEKYTISEAETYGITVAGVPVSESNAANVLGDDNATVKFDAENSVLTLNGATIRGSVVSSLESLTISLIGSNSITSSDGSAINGTGVLTISKDSEATGAVSLELDSSSQSGTTSPSVISGFSSFTTSLIDENGGAYNDNSKAFSYDGSPVTFVTFTSELSSVKNCFYSGKDDKGTYYIGFECFSDNVEIVYSIDYVSSDMEDVVEAVYQNENVLLGGPCTVTAWKRMGSVVSETITAKLFGFAETEITAVKGSTDNAIPEVVPPIAEVMEVMYSSSDEDMITNSENGTFNTNAYGTAVISGYLKVGNNAPDYVILNEEPSDFIQIDQSDDVYYQLGDITVTTVPDAPTFSLSPDEAYRGDQSLELSTTEENGVIKYFIGEYQDNDNPETYTEPITLTESTSVTAWVEVTVQSEAATTGPQTVSSEMVTMEFNITPIVKYGITVYPVEGAPVQVNEDNCPDVLGDGGTVRFDGNRRLVLNGATLQKIETGLDEGAELELYLEGANTISGSSNAIIDTNQMTPSMVIGTDGNNPGTLTLGAVGGVIRGFQSVEIKQPLAILSSTPVNATSLIGTTAAITAAHVGAPLGLIVDGVSTETAINYSDISGANEPVAANALTNLVINNVLYTLNDDGTKESPDGYDGGQIVLNSTMTDDDVSDINVRVENESLVPGTDAYATAFNGLTFMVPAGTGVITLNTKTDLGHEFHLKVGGKDPITVINYTDNNDVDFAVDYAVSKSTYVYLYLVKKSSATAPGYDGHRAGPKATISGGIGGMKVESSSIAVVPDPAATYYQMTASDYSKKADGSKYGIKVTNTAVTDLPDNAFATASPAPAYSGNRAPAGAISYIDLSDTQITGKVYNRASGAFAGVSKNTVIYLPAGNMAVGPNFVIGGVCDDMQLNAITEEAFELSKDFTAAKATFDRSFAAGKDAHGNDKCYTVYLPYAVNKAKAGGEFFTCGAYDAATGTINMTKVEAPNLEANTAYIYKPAADGVMSPMTSVKVVKPTAVAANPENASETTGLHGVYEYHQWTSEPGNVYCFAAGDATAVNGKDIKAGQFVKVGSGTHIKPFRAYLRISVPAGGSAPEYVAVDWGNGTTSIVPLDKTQVSQDADGWYTITGFRLPAKPTEKGIYIHNNKKTIVK